MSSIELPPAIRAHLVAVVEGGGWKDPAAAIAEIPHALPEGEVRRLFGRGPFGRLADGRLDVVGGRLALEVLENSRMSGEYYYRVWEDGAVERLEPAPRLNYSHPSDASEEEIAAVREEYFRHNRTAYDLLRERGFI